MGNPDSGRVLHAGKADRTLDAPTPREPIEHVARAGRRDAGARETIETIESPDPSRGRGSLGRWNVGTTARRAAAAVLVGLAALLAVPAGAEAQSENPQPLEADPTVPAQGPAQGDVRLVNGRTDYDGRLEIYLDDRWGSVCYHGFDRVDADVACRNLGMGRSTEIDIPWNWKGSHPVMNEPRCTGTEERLADCARDTSEPPWCFIQIVADITCNGHAATGAPAITGEPKVGHVLTADPSGVVDDDGLSAPNYTWRWLADDREIPGAEDVAYRLTEAEEGKRIKVRVGFTDDLGGKESLTSIATGAVPLLPKVVVQPTSLEMDEGASASYTVALGTEPTGEVTVAVGGTAGTDVTVSSASLTFTAATWNDPQTVTVSAAHDTDRLDEAVTLTHAASNADYDDVPVAPVSVTVLDDETTAPGAPTGVTATVPQRSYAIALGWTAPSDTGGSAVTGYRVEVSEGDETSWRVAAEIDSSVTGYTHGRLDAGTTYHYRVTAANRVDWSVPSASVSGTTLSGLADGILRLQDGNTEYEGRLEVHLNGRWGTVCRDGFDEVDADMACRDLGYGRSTRRFRPSSFGSGPVLKNPRCTGSEASFNDCPRTTGSNLCYRRLVSAVTCNGNSARGAPVVTGRAQVGYALTADTSGIVDDDGLSTPNFTYVWLADDNVIPGVATATLTLADAHAGKRIKVRVRFTDDQGGTETITSAAGEPVMPRPAIVLEAPAPFTVEEGAGATYTVALRTEPTGGEPSGEVTVAVGGTSGTDVTVSPSSLTFTTQSWNVAQTVTVSAAHDEDRVADAATLTHSASGADYGAAPGVDLAVTVFDDETDVPGAPTRLSAAVVGNGHRVVLAWTAPADSGGSDLAGYRIEVSEGSGEDWTVAADTASLDTGYTVGRLKPETAYRFRVSAANRVGRGEPSGSAPATTGASLVCGRTPQVRDAIVGAAALGSNPSSPDCREVTAEHLAAITTLRIRNESALSTLRAGDFAGMAALARIEISNTGLSGLPAAIFSGLPELRTLDLSDNALADLSAEGFTGLGALTSLDLGGNDLASLTSGAFTGLGALTSLDLGGNDLASLTSGAFTGLGALTSLDLGGNDLASLTSGAFTGLGALTSLDLDGNDLTGLPGGFFTALAGLTALDLRNNATAPVPVRVLLEKVGDGGIKAVAATGAPFDLTLPIAVSGGATVVGGAESLSIAAGVVESETVEITPRPVDDTAAVAVTFGTAPSPPGGHRGYRLALDEALELVPAVEWTVTVSASALTEADTDATTLTVSSNGFTFTENRTLDLGMGGTATGAGDDYTVADGSGTAMTPPYALSLPAGATTVTATITVVDDTVKEARETIEITVRDDGEAIGAQPTVTIADDDPTGDPEISIVAGKSPLHEGRDTHAVFTLSRRQARLDNALTVGVTVTQQGDFAAAGGLGTKSVTFLADAEEATLRVAIDDDGVGEFDGGTITAAIAAGDGYGVSGPQGSASVRVLDDELRLAVYVETPEVVVDEYNPPGGDSLWNRPRFTIRVETPPGGSPVPVGYNQLAYYDTAETASHKVASNGHTFIGDLFPVSAIGYLSITFDNEHYHRRADGAMVATRTLDGPPILNDWLLDDNEVFLVEIATVPGSGIWFPEAESESGPAAVRVRIRDSHRPSWRLSVTPDRISESGTEPTTVKVRVTRPFERSQRVTLELSGTAVEGVDYTIEDKTLTLPGGRYSVGTTLTPIDNPDAGEDKTVIVTARHEKKQIGTTVLYEGGPLGLERTLTIADDDSGVSITADASPVSEGTAAAFTLSRTGDATEALTVAVVVTETGAVLDGAAPTVASPEEPEPDAVLDGVEALAETEAEVVFAAGSATASLSIATTDDEVAEDASVVTVAIAPSEDYVVAAARPSAQVTVEDDDAAPVVATAAALEAPENGTAVATLAATDEDTSAADLTWSITGGADADKLAVTDAGALTFGAAKDYEAPDDADGDGVYEVTVEVSDGANAVAASLTVTLTDLDEIAPTLSEATVDGASLTLVFDEALDEDEVPSIDSFSVTVAGATRTVDNVVVTGSAVVLTLASAVTADEVVTVGYTVPTDAAAGRIRDAAGNAAAAFAGQAVTNATEPGNRAPTGLPEISGTPRVDEVLTVSVAGIADADGTGNATFAYRWLADDGVTVAEIAQATGTTFTPAATEVGKTIRVRVTFTDDRGTQETLVSAPTVAVAALPVVSLRTAAALAKEGDAALFILARTGDVSSALTVAVTIEASGAVPATPVPSGATFAAGVAEVELAVATVDDGTDGADGTVKARVVAGAGYRLAAGASTGSVTVLDDDPAPVVETVTGDVVWSADLTVVDYGTGAIGAGTADLISNEAGSAGLSARWLWYGTETRELRLAFTSGVADADDLVLQVSGLELAFPADSAGNSSFLWFDVDLSWTDGETVAARVVKPGGEGAATDATLSALTVTDAELTPAFDPQVLVYAAAVDADTETVTVTAATNDDDASVSYGPATDADEEQADHQASTPLGETLIAVTVTAADGETRRVYRVVATRSRAPVTVSFGASSYGAMEGGDAASVAVTLSGYPGRAVTIPLSATPGGGAVAADYAVPVGVTFAAGGSLTQTVSVAAIADEEAETGEHVVLGFGALPRGLVAGATGTATVSLADLSNRAPTGLPAISGTPRVGEVLTASAGAITDADGLENATFVWQWLADDGTVETAIADATGESHELTVAEVGSTVRVRVTFTDDRGTEETLASVATEAVAATVPSAPVGLAAATGEGREQELTVSWTAPESDGGSEVTGYTVQWKSGTEAWDGSQTSTRRAVLSDPAATSQTIGSLANGTAYTVRVMAVNAAGDGAAAAEVEATVRDRAAPTLAGAAVDGAALTLTYSEVLDDQGSAPAAGAFTVTVAGADRTVDEVALSESALALTLTLASAVAADETVTVGYTVPADVGAARIEDEAGNAAAGFTARAVVNATAPPPALTVTISVTDAAAQPGQFEVQIVFSERVTGFLVWELEAERVGGDAATVSDFTGSETLTEWTATVAAEAGRYRVRLPAGAAQAGTRQSPAAALTVDVDAEGNAVTVVGPVVTAVSLATAADGTWTDDDEVRVTLTFSEAVTVVTEGGTPSVEVALDGTARQAAYASGTGTASLEFVYTVAAEDGTVSSVTVTADSLAVNGGTIRDAAGRDADLDHPGLGEAATDEAQTESVVALTGLTLVDTGTGTEVVLADADALVLEDPANGSYGLVATVSADAGVGSVLLELTGAKTVTVTDDASPYSLYGDEDGTVTGAGLPAGSYTLSATAYTEAAGAGAELGTLAVSFTVTASEAVDPDALAASFEGVPAEHDGSSPFTFRVRFSQEPRVSYTVLRDESFAVTGGDVDKARRVDGRNDLREIHIEPEGWDDVAVMLAGGRACGTEGAICTADGKVLANTATALVRGPLALSVADARIVEAAGALLAFEVTLSRAASGTVTVDYATGDGTATAGADYTAVSDTLTFDAGETAKTVNVTVLDDAHDDTEETLTLTLSNATGARIRDAEATGTIENSDPIPQAWLSRFGRTVADHVVDAVAARLEGSPGGGSQVTLGGQRIALDGAGNGTSPGGGTAGSDARETAAAADTLAAFADRMSDDGAGTGRVGWGEGGGEYAWKRPAARTLSTNELLLGSSFVLGFGGDGSNGTGTAWTAWGRAAVSGFDGEADGLIVDGDVTTFTLGADAARGRWLGGVALAHSTGEGGFRDHGDTEDHDGGEDHDGLGSGTLESTLTGVHPYLRFEANERLLLWGVLGYGAGDLTLELDAAGDNLRKTWKTDTEMWMTAAGARGVLLSAADHDGFELAARGDARLVRMSSEAVTGAAAGAAGAGPLSAAESQTSRMRFILEGSRGIALAGGQALRPTLEVGLRLDGGDAETGTGIELGAGVSYADPALGLTVEGKARGLVAHEDTDYREWGASGSVRIDPGAAGRGLSLTLTPAWGADTGGAERLWSARDARALAANDTFEPAGRLDAQAGYGLGAFAGRGLATPFAGLSLSDAGSRTWRSGVRWTLGPDLAFGVEGALREAGNDTAAEHEVGFRASFKW